MFYTACLYDQRCIVREKFVKICKKWLKLAQSLQKGKKYFHSMKTFANILLILLDLNYAIKKMYCIDRNRS